MSLRALEWFFLSYFLLLNGGYIALNLLSFNGLRRYMERHSLAQLPQAQLNYKPNYELPISVLVAAYNEEASIVASVKSLLRLDYPDYEIIVINDGSTDTTLATLIRNFDLQPFTETFRQPLSCQEIRQTYRSPTHRRLRVIDKSNGGKSDALNAGINASRCPLFCAVDADSVLQHDALSRVVQPFIEDARTIVTGGTIRIANGCRIEDGRVIEVGLPRKQLVRFQVVEYLRAFLFGRLGWAPLNAVLIVSGAFGLFRKSTVVTAGGYRTDTVGEDMELILRLHSTYRTQGTDYRIAYVPDPICWTEAPESLDVLKSQRTRWQRGLSESLMINRALLFHPRSGWAGWLAFPFFVVFELLGPAIEILGYLVMTIGFLTGAFSVEAFLAFLMAAIAFGVLLSVTALLLEEMSFRLYPQPGHILSLFIAAVLENFGYRQLVAMWRLQGLLRWLMGKKQSWGEMKRSNVLRKHDTRSENQNCKGVMP